VTLTFDLVLIGGRGIVMDYPCAKFGELISVVLILSCGQTDRQNHIDGSTLYTDYIEKTAYSVSKVI